MQSKLSSWMRGAAAGAGVALAVAVAPGAAMAGVLSQTLTFGPSNEPWTNTFNFTGFNPLLGTLSQVTISATETLAGTAIVSNTNPVTSPNGTATGTVTETNTLVLGSPIGVTTVNAVSSTPITVANGASSPSIPLAGSATQSATYVSGLSVFVGPWSASGSDTGSSGAAFNTGNVTEAFTDQGAASITVTYTYGPTPVPEPASVAIFAVGLLGLVMVSRRRA